MAWARGFVCALLMLVSCGTATLNPVAHLKIGFIFVGDRDDLGYNQAAWEGADAVARVFPDVRLLRRENVGESDEATKAMESLIAEGATLIFATSFGHQRYAYDVARRHPEVIVVHEGGVEPKPRLSNFGTFWGTVWEPVYQAGIVAGSVSSTGTLGFVAAFPIPSTFANINAFTLGARSVNPSVTVRVEFTGSWCDPARQRLAARSLLALGADVLTQHQDCTKAVLEVAEAAGARSVGYHSDGSEVAAKGWLVGAVWNWRPVYVDIVRSVVEGRFSTSRYNGDYRGSYRSGDNPFVLTELGPSVPASVKAAVDAAGERFRAGASPFAGPLRDRDGVLRVPAGTNPTIAEVDRFDFFVGGVVGTVPERLQPRPSPSVSAS